MTVWQHILPEVTEGF